MKNNEAQRKRRNKIMNNREKTGKHNEQSFKKGKMKNNEQQRKIMKQ